VPEHREQEILRRGARADTAQPGHGIGLAVAVDIVSAYRGSFAVGRSSELGGAEFTITFPL
jgi:two-component system sensor histidine kinase PhoQ